MSSTSLPVDKYLYLCGRVEGMKIEASDIAGAIVALYDKYCEELVSNEMLGRGNYTDEDFKDLRQFIEFIRNNH